VVRVAREETKRVVGMGGSLGLPRRISVMETTRRCVVTAE